jgi:hypothetical protein
LETISFIDRWTDADDFTSDGSELPTLQLSNCQTSLFLFDGLLMPEMFNTKSLLLRR